MHGQVISIIVMNDGSTKLEIHMPRSAASPALKGFRVPPNTEFSSSQAGKAKTKELALEI